MRVLVATGSSGGHMFPALSFLEALRVKRPDIETLLMVPRKSIIGNIEEIPCRIKFISITPLRAQFNFKNLVSAFNFLKGSLQSLLIITQFRPQVVVGFGSLSCIPAILSAWLLRIPALIHEQNVIPGRANRFLSFFADRICISFSATRSYLKRHIKKITCTGNPLRHAFAKIDRRKAREFFRLSPDTFTILVIGGSQGSHHINVEFLKAVSAMGDKAHVQVIHLSGAADYRFLKVEYERINIDARLFDFLKPMHYAYSACDLAISRAGATTISEIIFFGVPALLIPYPHAYAHQFANAKALEENGAGRIVRDDAVNAGMLKNNIEYFMYHPQTLKNMRLAYRDFPVYDAAGMLAEEALKLAS
jgi:UDP-N-acetylglucosamine--N-acetylmuramyl-(pentapeptide) pyrophosphoryl-undecaprenol N-acetylglucosamine transferase